MKIKNEFSLIKSSGQNIVITKKPQKKPLNTIVLTDTSVFLWKLLKENDVSKSDMLDALMKEFDLSVILALSDIDIFIRTMRENDILE
ncbi:MAG: PqqD family protein [Ruminococcaceae bacterium]|nr:PqqD family protein [Oscillospiraceae bacterium]